MPAEVPPYREFRPPASLTGLVACVWEYQPTRARVQRVIPDGCVDLIWLGERELVFAGPDTGPRTVNLPAGTRSAGIRFRPGAAGSILGMPASEIRDQNVPARLVWGDDAEALTERLDAADPHARLRLLATAAGARDAEPDPLVRAALRPLSAPGARVGDVAAALGISERSLLRRTRTAVGYGPKLLARVARLRRLIVAADASLSRRAFVAGYASQAHMTDEVGRLTGLTPVRFLEDAALTAA